MQACFAALLVGALVVSAGCKAECRDEDGDERGEGCPRGPDCDDSDPLRARSCTNVPDHCASEPTGKGCPCPAALDDRCSSGDPATEGVGVCVAGRARCLLGVFGACEAEVVPSDETCNGEDDDCDGVLDEWVRSPCGGCDASCVGAVWGVPPSSFAAEGGGTALTPSGELTLRQKARMAAFVWVPNTDEGTVSKLDVGSARELARYRTPGGHPIRVAVDQRGDAWVLDRPDGLPGRLSKIVAERERCVDRDGDGLETSSRPDDVRASDECLELDIALAASGDDARALAIDGAASSDSALAGNVWVGSAERVDVYAGNSGERLGGIELPGFAAHDGRFDVWGKLWLLERDGRLAEIDPVSEPPEVSMHEAPLACYAFEALSIAQEQPLLIASPSCESVARFEPEADGWLDRRVPGLLSPRALAAHGDSHWLIYTSGELARLDPGSLEPSEPIGLTSQGLTPFESHALAADGAGRLWIVSTQGGPDGRGLVTRYDPGAGQVSAQVAVGKGPRGAGDLTGLGLGAPFVSEASQRHVFESGCGQQAGVSAGAGTRWKAIHLAARVGAGGEVELAVRRADAVADLEEAEFETLGVFPWDESPYLLDVPDEGVLEVQLTLRARYATGAPRVARVGLEWVCAGPE